MDKLDKIEEKMRNTLEKRKRSRVRNWIKRKFDLYDISDLIIGGRCGCCGKWIGDDIFPKGWTWGLCEECISASNKDERSKIIIDREKKTSNIKKREIET